MQIGQKEGNFEALGRELDQLQDLLQENKELRSVLYSFAYPAPTRKKIAGTLAKTLGLSKTTGDFLNLLIDRERMDHFSEIVKSYQGLCDEATNRIRATLVTPADLPPDRVEEVKKQLEARTGKAGHPLLGTRSLPDRGRLNQDRECDLRRQFKNPAVQSKREPI